MDVLSFTDVRTSSAANSDPARVLPHAPGWWIERRWNGISLSSFQQRHSFRCPYGRCLSWSTPNLLVRRGLFRIKQRSFCFFHCFSRTIPNAMLPAQDASASFVRKHSIPAEGQPHVLSGCISTAAVKVIGLYRCRIMRWPSMAPKGSVLSAQAWQPR